MQNAPDQLTPSVSQSVNQSVNQETCQMEILGQVETLRLWPQSWVPAKLECQCRHEAPFKIFPKLS